LFPAAFPEYRVRRLRLIRPPGFTAFLHKCDGAGRPKFAIQIRITASAAIRAKINLVLHAHEIRLNIRMVSAFSHCLCPAFALWYLKLSPKSLVLGHSLQTTTDWPNLGVGHSVEILKIPDVFLRFEPLVRLDLEPKSIF
jgi:hypothetical protein